MHTYLYIYIPIYTYVYIYIHNIYIYKPICKPMNLAQKPLKPPRHLPAPRCRRCPPTTCGPRGARMPGPSVRCPRSFVPGNEDGGGTQGSSMNGEESLVVLL